MSLKIYVREGVYIDELSGVLVCEACDCALENGRCICYRPMRNFAPEGVSIYD